MGDEKEKKINKGRAHISCQYKQSSRCVRKEPVEIIGMDGGFLSRKVGTIKSVSPRHNGLCIPESMAGLEKLHHGKCMEDSKGARGLVGTGQTGSIMRTNSEACCYRVSHLPFAICEFYVPLLGGRPM
jgi:hypothetical protein